MPRVHVRVVILWVCHCIASKPHNLNPQTFKKPLSHKNAKFPGYTVCNYYFLSLFFS